MLARLALCVICGFVTPSHGYTMLPGARPAASRLSVPASRTSAAPGMGLIDWLGTMIYERELGDAKRRPSAGDSAGSSAVSRLKVVLAHDRTGLDEITMAKIRGEIQAVVAKYVTIDVDDVCFDMQNDDEITLVTASFPLQAPRSPLQRAGAISGGGPSIAP